MRRIGTTKIDDGWAWRWYAQPDPDALYLGLATYFELRSGWGLPRFQWYTYQVHRQLVRQPGLVGYTFRGHFPTRYWTLSAWQDGGKLREFVRAMPHGQVMTALQPAMARFGSARWRVPGSALPLFWADGLERLAAEEAHAQRRQAQGDA